MHELYIQESNEKGNETVSLTTYRTIFSENYNLDFFKPKKDQLFDIINLHINYNKATVDNDNYGSASPQRASLPQSAVAISMELVSFNYKYYVKMLCVQKINIY